ncbi:hypothetical protein D9757_008317 [Collybiopsis confluens]|uniref:Ubiquitin-like protease family profile domain-containing protein n=1 Tax=Collybiopsis confluens TaxID=2823264 RepID=A0A8H5HEU1_9AGAR|nr:hypothetical protein D9757_008317 [Collybiopsis confluens]
MNTCHAVYCMMSRTSISPTSTRITHSNIHSPSRRSKHKKCFPFECPPFGCSRSCTRPILEQIMDIVEHCKAFLPSLSLPQLLNSTTTNALLASDFPVVDSVSCNRQFYSDSTFQLNQLQEAANTLLPAAGLQSKIVLLLKHHRALPSDNIALVVLGNLKILQGSISRRRVMVECDLWQGLDAYPEQTAVQLRVLVNQSTLTPAQFDGKLAFVKLNDFRTLGVGRWLNDEVINYFVEKWCSESGTTLGLNSFFAPRCLFDEVTGMPKSGVLTTADEDRISRWCAKTVEKQGLKDWDSVFIPINETHTHWYSARIDFHQRRIDIYDSLREKCINNRKKPPLLRENANLMLVLIWLAEVLSQLRGEVVDFKNNLGGRWSFDPHFKVHFQPNSYDCGVHLLWHLRHLLQFQQIELGDNCLPRHLRFTNDMVSKRLRLAQEMLADAGFA